MTVSERALVGEDLPGVLAEMTRLRGAGEFRVDSVDHTSQGPARALTVPSLQGGGRRVVKLALPPGCLGVVSDFGWINRNDRTLAGAVAALGGPDLSALVFPTEAVNPKL